MLAGAQPGDDRRYVLEQNLIFVDRARVVGESLGILQIAHVVRHYCLTVAQQAERTLQLTTHRQHRRCVGKSIR